MPSGVNPWLWRPNWRDGLVERLTWQTDVIRAWSGREARARLRDQPRQSWELSLTSMYDQRQRITAAIAASHGELIELPIWPDVTRLAAAANAGATSLACDTSGRGFVAGGYALIGALTNWALLTIASVPVGGASLTLSASLAASWAEGTRVYPVRQARVVQAVERASFTPDVAQWRLTFEVDDWADPWVGTDGALSYYGLPLWVERPNWAQQLAHTRERPLELADGDTGPRQWYAKGDLPILHARHTYTVIDRPNVAALRRALYARAGRWKPAWLPSYEQDLRLIANANAGTKLLKVARVGWAGRVGEPEFRHLQIALTDGSRLYAEAVSAVVTDATTETLTLLVNLDRALTPETVLRISWLRWCRLAADQVELRYHLPELVTVQLGWQALRLVLGEELLVDDDYPTPEIEGMAQAAPAVPSGVLLYALPVPPEVYTQAAGGDEALAQAAPAIPTGTLA